MTPELKILAYAADHGALVDAFVALSEGEAFWLALLPDWVHQYQSEMEAPFLLLRAHRRRPVDLGQAVDVREVEAERFHALDHRRRRRRRGHHAAHDLAVDDEAGRVHHARGTRRVREVEPPAHPQRAPGRGRGPLRPWPNDAPRADRGCPRACCFV